MAMAMPFAHKTKLVWPGVYNNPPEVGVGQTEMKPGSGEKCCFDRAHVYRCSSAFVGLHQ
jgi:hypothetical protein